jgi:hypothetical protein
MVHDRAVGKHQLADQGEGNLGMADYFTQEVVTEPALITTIMEEVLVLRGAELYPDGDENALDHLVSGVQARTHSIGFEEGWRDGGPSELIEWHEPDLDHLSDEDRKEFDRLLAMGKADFFHEVLKINPKKTNIELQAAWTCSKMRLDGFGGSGLFISRKGYLYVTTCRAAVDDDGTIRNLNEFTPWE